MFYNFFNNLINVNEISSVYQSKSGTTEYPYSLTISMKNGMTVKVKQNFL